MTFKDILFDFESGSGSFSPYRIGKKCVTVWNHRVNEIVMDLSVLTLSNKSESMSMFLIIWDFSDDWVNHSSWTSLSTLCGPYSDTIWNLISWSTLMQVMTYRLGGAKPLPEQILIYCQSVPTEQTSMKSESKYKHYLSWKCISKCCL